MDERIIIMLLFLMPLIVTFVQGQLSVKDLCSERGDRQHDKDVARLLTIGDSGRRFPENNGADLKKYCAESSRLIADINHHKEVCLKDLAKQVSSVMIYAGRATMNKLCKAGSKTLDRLLEASSCANQGAKEIQKCYVKLIDNMQGILHEKDEKKRIPLMCCEYVGLFPCVENTLKNVNKCTERKVYMLNDFVKGIMGNAVDLICGEYSEDSDKCQKIGEPPKKKKWQKRPKSFAFPMIDILDSIKEQ